ncbi:alpha/beta hydrolase [Aquiflexum sp.]|uniref:alpha/beta hydrolase n=1 Tax=Aquiflexum sp. TaxID=1872584 RepID=UPI00359337FC
MYLRIFYPSQFESSRQHPAMVFFFGGGWSRGNINQFKPHSEYFSKLGMITILVDYRVSEMYGTTPKEALKDAKSAMRFLKANASKYGIDSNNITAAGGSAGGHLAAATVMSKNINDYQDDLQINPAPNALVLFNPVLDNGPEGYGYERVKDYYLDFSPFYNVRENLPPTIIFIGTEDHLIPIETITTFQNKMRACGNICEVIQYEGQGHGFFNIVNRELYEDTIEKTVVFLKKNKILD